MHCVLRFYQYKTYSGPNLRTGPLSCLVAMSSVLQHLHVVSVPSQIPKSGTLWSLYVDFKHKRLLPWETIIPVFHYNSEQPFFEMLVPTTDTVRYGYLMEKLLSVRRSVLFTGGTGVGKVNRVFFLFLFFKIISSLPSH